MTQSTITITDGATSATGPAAVNVMRLCALVAGLRFELKTNGMKLSRGPSCLAIAKQTTGLRTNDRAKQIEAVEALLAKAREAVTYIDQRTNKEG